MTFPNTSKILFEQHINQDSYKSCDISELYEKVVKNLDQDLKVPADVLNSFQIKDNLNPEIWDGDKIKPEISKKLIETAKIFIKTLELPTNVKMKDILFTGSLANYNWSKFSDVDLHIIIDFNDFNEEKELIKKYFDAEKNLWNLKHDIELFGYPVEVYVQDLTEKLSASAVYSLPKEKWILKPDKENFKVDKALLMKRVKKIFDKFVNIKTDYEAEKYNQVIEKTEQLKADIKQMRKSGLEKGGEFSLENLIFKVLRRTDFMEMLDGYKNNAYDKDLSLNEVKVIPYDERPELRAAAKNGVSNKDVISDEKLRDVQAQLVMAKNAVNAFKEAYASGKDSFEINYMGHKLTGRIPPAMRDTLNGRGEPFDYSGYFDIPNLGDGGFQYKLFRNGNLAAAHVQARPDMYLNPNLTTATDAGYNKTFDDRLKYFSVKAGIKGKYQGEAKIYSVFPTPAIDGGIKVRVINHAEILDFLTKDKGAAQYTSDEKGNQLANAMDLPKKIEKVRKDAEAVIGKPLSSNQDWMTWRDDFIGKMNDEQKANFEINLATNEFIRYYKQKNNIKDKPQVSLSPEDLSDFQQRQALIQKRIAQMKARRGY